MRGSVATTCLFLVVLGCHPTLAQTVTTGGAPTAEAVQPAQAGGDGGDDAEDEQPADPRLQALFVPIYDPSGDALTSFHQALARAEAGKGQARIAFYGASHTAADIWTGQLRRTLQHRYGDAGHGFLLPVRWHGGYRHQDINTSASRGWDVHRHRMVDPVPVGDFGYTGVAVSSDDPAQWAEVRTCTDNVCGRRADTVEIWVRAEPGGGTLLAQIDGQIHEVSTAAAVTSVQFERFDLDDGGHTLRLSPKGDGVVRLYGVVLQRKAPGVILDQLGIPGMRGDILLTWQEKPWREQLQRRDPHLIVLAYGTNAVGDTGQPMSIFRSGWRRVLERVRAAAPDASCLLVGPTDRPSLPDEHGVRSHRPRMDRVIEAQREVAAEYGCGHWDAFAAMGGRGSMVRWVPAGLASRDHVHLTRAGYELKAERLLHALLENYSAGASALSP